MVKYAYFIHVLFNSILLKRQFVLLKQVVKIADFGLSSMILREIVSGPWAIRTGEQA
jgi:hypothetical protein